jgi:hypothetical protein
MIIKIAAPFSSPPAKVMHMPLMKHLFNEANLFLFIHELLNTLLKQKVELFWSFPHN